MRATMCPLVEENVVGLVSGKSVSRGSLPIGAVAVCRFCSGCVPVMLRVGDLERRLRSPDAVSALRLSTGLLWSTLFSVVGLQGRVCRNCGRLAGSVLFH